MEERRIDLVKREKIDQQDKRIKIAEKFLKEKKDVKHWEDELTLLHGERLMILEDRATWL